MNSTGTSPVWRRTGIAVACAAAIATSAAIAPAVAGAAHIFSGDLADLSPATADPFHGATAKVTLVGHGDASTVVLLVKGLDPSLAGRTFGAHLHSGPCVPGNGAAAGPHYNHSGVVPPLASSETEVWLDFTVNDGGNGQAVAHVDWVPTPGQRSVVIHRDATAPGGAAGPRLACLPVEW